MKKTITVLTAFVITLSSAAVLPKGEVSLCSQIVASAETYGDYKYTVLDDNTVEISKYIGKDNNTDIPEIINGKTVTIIGSDAFSKCSNLISVKIPKSIVYIYETAFNDCNNLESIVVDSKNTCYASVDGMLYSKDMVWLKRCPQAKTDPNISKEVRFIEEYAFADCTKMESITIPYGVNNISDHSFLGCSNLKNIYVDKDNTFYSSLDGLLVNNTLFELVKCPSGRTSVVLPESITDIAPFAFMDCKALESVELSDNIQQIDNKAFSDCTALKSITIPSSVKYIGAWAFENCTSLTDVTISDGVEYIYNGAFHNCKSLKNITIPNSIIEIGAQSFMGCSGLSDISLPKGITSIENGTFDSCESLTDIIIPDNVTIIGEYAFNSCTKLKMIQLPDSITEINEGAFYFCTDLGEITIPKSVKKVGKSVFAYNESLLRINVDADNLWYCSFDGVLYNKDMTELIYCPIKKSSINIPYGVKRIANEAFANNNLTEISLPDSLTDIGEGAFYNCASLEKIIIPDSVISIEPWAFMQCKKLKSIKLPNGLKYISHSLFMECTDLQSIVIPDTVKSIDELAFEECTALSSINIPESVTSIGWCAFWLCSELKSIVIPKSVKTIGEGAFSDCDNITIKCYSGSTAEKHAKENKIKYQLLDKPSAPATVKISIAKATVSGLSNKTYTGKAITQSPVVKLSGKTLKAGTDYTVAYKNNTKVGTATVTITGKGSYTGTISKTFKINVASIAKATVSGLSNKTYTGKAITQNPTVKLGSKTLKKGTDYTVTFKNNKAVGKATVTIKGKGNYTGTISKTFKINPKKTTLKTATCPKTKQLNVTYSKVSGVTGYQTVYSTSSKFTKATTKTASSKNTSKTISGLTKGKTYYVKVRTYKTVKGTKYYSGYSAVKKVKIK